MLATLLSAGGSCTLFDGLSVGPEPDAGGYLPLDQAVQACSLVVQCPTLGAAIVQSVGVPASRTSFSSCLGWLAGPIPNDRFGWATQRGVLNCIAGASTCDDALSCTFFQPVAANDPRCDGGAGDTCLSESLLLHCASQTLEILQSPAVQSGKPVPDRRRRAGPMRPRDVLPRDGGPAALLCRCHRRV